MRFAITLLAVAIAINANSQSLPLLDERQTAALASEISGESAMRNVEGLARHHRMRGSRGFRAAADQIVAELKRYGLADARVESLPADGKIFYGTQRSRSAWNADFAELWELDADGTRVARLASWETAPITVAQDSESGDVTTTLVDIGAGTRESDYAGKDVKGKLVLTSSQPGAVAPLAVGRFGAAGIISYAQNQRSAWWGEDENLVRWGHLETFAPEKTFGFMVSLKTARALQQRLGRGETIRMHAVVRAGQEPGAYDIATATIAGTDLRGEEIVFSCHLDHPRPGANDNASGCATILEVARTLSKLIDEERLPRPLRTIRFVWPPEIEGTLALLTGPFAQSAGQRPIAERIKAAVHLDMVGGGPETKAIFHVTRGPASQPSFVYDVAQSVGMFVNEQTARFAMTGSAKYPLVAPTGGKEPLRAAFVPLTLGSDHMVYSDSSFGIPAIYLNDWPDRYIHTNRDIPANIDPTKLARAGFIAAASGYILASAAPGDAAALGEVIRPLALERTASALRRDDPNAFRFALWYERGVAASLARFGIPPISDAYVDHLAAVGGPAGPARPSGVVYRRNPKIRGTMTAFGYDYFPAHYPRAPEIELDHEYRYEALNLVNGLRTTSQIRDDLAAIYGDVPLADVERYLEALASIDVILPSGTAP